MAITSLDRRTAPFTGNGVVAAVPFAFKVFATDDLAVYRDTGGGYSLATLGVDYTVALNVDQDASPGGTVTFAAPVPNGVDVLVISAVDARQPITLTAEGGFRPSVVTNGFDRSVALIQQMQEQISRAVRTPLFGAAMASLPDQGDRAGAYLAFDALGDPVAAVGTGADVGLRADLAAATGGGLVGFGSRSVAARLQDVLHDADYPDLASALTAAAAEGRILNIVGDHASATGWDVPDNTVIVFVGGALTATSNAINLLRLGHGCTVINARLYGPNLAEDHAAAGYGSRTGFGILIDSRSDVLVDGGFIADFGQGGVKIQGFGGSGCRKVRVRNVTCIGNKWNVEGGAGDIDEDGYNNQDISIQHNWLHSNTSAGVNCNVVGFSLNVEVNRNWIVTLDRTTFAPLTGVNVVRRHGVGYNYVGGNPSNRVKVSDNWVFNTRWTGGYDQSQNLSGDNSQTVFSGNMVVGCGHDHPAVHPWPADLEWPGRPDYDTTVAAGVIGGLFLQSAGNSAPRGNVFIGCDVGVNAQFPVGASPCSLRDNSFFGNRVGVNFGGQVRSLTIAGCQFAGSLEQDILGGVLTGFTEGGGIDIYDNDFDRTEVNRCIQVDTQNATKMSFVHDNRFHGAGKDEHTAQSLAANLNVAVFWRFGPVEVYGNSYKGFHRGFELYGGVATNTRVAADFMRFRDETFEDCNFAYLTGGSSTTVIYENPTLRGGTALDEGGGGKAGEVRSNGSYQIYTAAAAAPASGTWAVGDEVRNATPMTGQPVSRGCGTAGTPGTWVAAGNYA